MNNTISAGRDGGRTTDAEWRPVRISAYGLQPQLERDWPADPAWDIHAVYARADGELRRADGTRHGYVFWNRHIDRRFHVEYPRTTRHAVRVRSRTIRDPDREWDILVEHRDRYLREAGLTLDSPPEAIARCLADTFTCDGAFKDKPACTTFESQPRALTNPIEGLLHKAFCVGCAHAFAALADACGLPARTVGWGGHRLAEVCVNGRWHMVENSCRHPGSQALKAFFPASVMEVTLGPAAYADCMPPGKGDQYLAVSNCQYHFMGGSWQSPRTLRLAAGNAHALYPELDRWGFKSSTGTHLPLVLRANGFYWEDLIHPEEQPEVLAARRRNTPFAIAGREPISDFLYHPLPPGERLRQSVWLDDLDGMTGLEVTIPIAPEPHIDAGAELGGKLRVGAGSWSQSLLALGAWPGSEPDDRGHRRCTCRVPVAALRPRAVNWIEFRNDSAETFQAPFIPAAMEPYMPPLGGAGRRAR